MARTLVLGAGFGGITVATELRRLLGDEHEGGLGDRGERCAMGWRKLWAVVGVGSYEEGSRRLELLDWHGIKFLRRDIEVIHPVGRRIETEQDEIEGDYLVVALGAETRPDLVPGLAEHTHNVWSAAGVPGLKAALADFEGGSIAIVIAGVPYACPPAPYECTMLIDHHLRDRGLREQSRITVATVQPMLLPNAGRDGSEWLARQLANRDIDFQVGRKIERFEAGRVVFADSELEADLIVAIPPHRAPAVVKASGMTGDGEWISVDPATLETDWKRVYAIGDVTLIKLANGLPLPKAGIMAELEGQTVAAAIAADVKGMPSTATFNGQGFCFMEMGKTEATLIEGHFYTEPEPRVRLGEISAANLDAKHRFEAERLERWFGM